MSKKNIEYSHMSNSLWFDFLSKELLTWEQLVEKDIIDEYHSSITGNTRSGKMLETAMIKEVKTYRTNMCFSGQSNIFQDRNLDGKKVEVFFPMSWNGEWELEKYEPCIVVDKDNIIWLLSVETAINIALLGKKIEKELITKKYSVHFLNEDMNIEIKPFKVAFEYKDFISSWKNNFTICLGIPPQATKEFEAQTFMEQKTNLFDYEDRYYFYNNAELFSPEIPPTYDTHLLNRQYIYDSENYSLLPNGWECNGSGFFWELSGDVVNCVYEKSYTYNDKEYWCEYEKEYEINYFRLNFDTIKEEMKGLWAKKVESDKEAIDKEELMSISNIRRLLKQNKEEILSVEDSEAVGNCSSGTDAFIKKYKLERGVFVADLMRHARFGEMLDIWDFRKVVLEKFSEKE